jgi:hypothetical protein
MEHKCNYCNVSFKRNCELTRHKNTQKCKNNTIKYGNHIEIKENLEKKDTQNNELQNKINSLEKECEELKLQLKIKEQETIEKNTIIKNIQDKAEEYRKIVENVSLNNMKENKFVSKKDKDILNTTFEIDINLNDKQINRTKYKDVPEDQVKKDIQSLKLKDNYQLEYREEDGFINITNLCKAGGKHFKHWNSIDKTKRFLEVLSSAVGIPTSEIIKAGTGSNYLNSQTWAHPQVAINIAQWISPKFDVLVSKWVYEIVLTGKVLNFLKKLKPI